MGLVGNDEKLKAREWIAGDQSLQETMADPYTLRGVQRQQLHAMDSIQYYFEHYNEVLQRFGLCSGHDEHDIHDNVHTVDISCQLSS